MSTEVKFINYPQHTSQILFYTAVMLEKYLGKPNISPRPDLHRKTDAVEDIIGSLKYIAQCCKKLGIDHATVVQGLQDRYTHGSDELRHGLNDLQQNLNVKYTGLIKHVILPSIRHLYSAYTLTRGIEALDSNINRAIRTVPQITNLKPTFLPLSAITHSREGIIRILAEAGDLLRGGVAAVKPSPDLPSDEELTAVATIIKEFDPTTLPEEKQTKKTAIKTANLDPEKAVCRLAIKQVRNCNLQDIRLIRIASRFQAYITNIFTYGHDPKRHEPDGTSADLQLSERYATEIIRQRLKLPNAAAKA